jgi:hypothetical protein
MKHQSLNFQKSDFMIDSFAGAIMLIAPKCLGSICKIEPAGKLSLP